MVMRNAAAIIGRLIISLEWKEKLTSSELRAKRENAS